MLPRRMQQAQGLVEGDGRGLKAGVLKSHRATLGASTPCAGGMRNAFYRALEHGNCSISRVGWGLTGCLEGSLECWCG